MGSCFNLLSSSRFYEICMTVPTDRSSSGRTAPLPKYPWVMRMTWSELLFAHWPVDPDAVAALLPEGLTLDTRDGQAWVGVVPFLMSRIAPRCCPPIPRRSQRYTFST